MSEPTNAPEPEEVPETSAAGDAAAAEGDRADQPGPTVRDKRRIDPVTGKRRDGNGPDAQGGNAPAGQDPVLGAKVSELEELVAERTADLQRLQAEYANYKKRVDRDRGLARTGGIEAVVLDLLPVLDSVEAAREHEELVGGFKLVADELEKISGKYGLEVFGEVGEPFDPQLHEALMHMPYTGEDEITETTISAVMQKGVKLNERVLRPARVAVADPS
ncbi:MAG: nucleotide exchange factor GrpE [Propionicimonas sp.]|nr:nucleotide exchange factor GrpE [Propionicimonas sp.]